MVLGPAAGTVTLGATVATLVTFRAPRYLRDTRVWPSTTGLSAGAAAKFYLPASQVAAATSSPRRSY